jgi:Tat protein secretion system quality control protein TatD with DNase activity
MTYLQRLITAYGLTGSDIQELKHARRQAECIEEYECVVKVLGHHPTTTELEATPQFHTLYNKIRRLWGAHDAFRARRLTEYWRILAIASISAPTPILP